MSLKVYAKRAKPLSADGDFGNASDAVVSLEDDYEYGDEEDEEQLSGKPPEQYDESEFETTTVRCCGAFCCVLLGVFTLSWVIHAIPISTITDIPPFARSALWMSIAHHTDAWKDAQGAYSPPPPAFGDGFGHFPDQ